jgi:isopentenyldiphosphate isomerase
MPAEYFDIVDDNNKVIGRARRDECHGNPALVHRTAHVLVVNSKGELYLQKRSPEKDIQPGKWDTSVGGHLDPGESYEQAAVREMREELGIGDTPIRHLYDYPMRNAVESENIRTFLAVWDGDIRYDPQEIETGRFWTMAEIEDALGTGIFTPNFEEEFGRFRNTV